MGSLNLPRPASVETDDAGTPRAINSARGMLLVASIAATWQVENGHEHITPIRRRYFRVVLEDGATRTLFQDLLTGAWHEHEY
jgi:hypothetical protein